MKLRVVVVYGSVRDERQGIKAAKFVVRALKKRKHDVDFIDPLVYDLPLLKKMYKSYEKGKAPEVLERLSEIFKNADAVVVVSGEYNHSIPPALSNLLDHFLEEYSWKPSGIVCYSGGGFGGVRAAMQLRAMLAEMGMSSIPSIMSVPNVKDSFDDEGNPKDKEYNRRIKKFLDELEWYAKSLKVQRKKGVPY